MRGVRRKILESCLEIAALQVNEADELLKKQADLLVELDSEGHDTAAARQLLTEFCTLLRRHHLDWVRVGQELREADRPLLRWPSSAEGK